LPLVRWFAYFFSKIIKSVKGVGSGDVSDAINQVSVVINQAWDATNEASDGTTDAWDGVNQASDEANEAWDAINEASVITNQAWDGTNEASDEANQASVIAEKPRKVAKNATFTGFGGSNGQNQTVLVRDGKAVEGHRSPRRWRVGRWRTNCAKRLGVRQPSGALGGRDA
jgi:uncharacterized phage infection (PIP) family protein YhgE